MVVTAAEIKLFELEFELPQNVLKFIHFHSLHHFLFLEHDSEVVNKIGS